MNKELQSLCNELKQLIQTSYEEGVTLEYAEKLAGRFLAAQMELTEALRKSDLDARMKKAGQKALKAAVYMEEATKGDKKPSDVMLNALVDKHEIVLSEQAKLDEAEVETEALQNYFNIFKEAHLHFRAIAKGRFE